MFDYKYGFHIDGSHILMLDQICGIEYQKLEIIETTCILTDVAAFSFAFIRLRKCLSYTYAVALLTYRKGLS